MVTPDAGAGEPAAAPTRSSRAERPGIGAVLAAAIPGLVALGLYLPGLMPGLGNWDTAEFQALGPTLGIAHPTGYPGYTLLLWLASVVFGPLGEPAYRANLLSALLTAGAASLAAVAILQLTRRAPLALAGGLVLAVAPVAWANALRADPHPLHLFLAALLLVLLLAWGARERAADPRAGRFLLAAAAVWALALGNHALTLLLAPGVGLYVLLATPVASWRTWRRWRLVLGCALTVAVVVVALYAYLPIRSSMGPALDYAHPADWIRTGPDGSVTGGFRYLVLGEQFQGTFRELPPADEAVGLVWAQILANLGVAAWLVPVGIVAGLVRRPRETVLLLAWFAITWRFSLGYLNASIERYYLVPILIAVLWAALGLDGIVRFLRWARDDILGRDRAPTDADAPAAADPGAGDAGVGVRVGAPADPRSPGRGRRIAGAAASGAAAIALAALVLLAPLPDAGPAEVAPGAPVAAALAAVVPASAVAHRSIELDASGDTWSRMWLEEVLAALPEDAVVFSWWGWSTTLWYGLHVEGRRPDILVIDDRDVLDDGYPSGGAVIERWLGERPLFLVRLGDEIERIRTVWELEELAGIGTGSPVWRVVPPPSGG
ncbi:MAG: protein O-mannosyl-transferase family [Chloroflexota bacterium]